MGKRIMRGLKDIRTHAGRADLIAEPYSAFLRIGALEMEKARRRKERENAINRVNSIDARFKEIEAEKTAIVQGLAERNHINTPNDTRCGKQTPTRRTGKGMLTIRY